MVGEYKDSYTLKELDIYGSKREGIISHGILVSHKIHISLKFLPQEAQKHGSPELNQIFQKCFCGTCGSGECLRYYSWLFFPTVPPACGL
jgi:hypothetical protein